MRAIIVLGILSALTWSQLWFTPDQQGERLMKKSEFQGAAETYRDPMRQGVAWYRAGEFEKAEQAFARAPTAEAHYNRGNCLIFRGKYKDAIERYDRALELRPDWDQAKTNREIAIAREKRTERKGGDMGDQHLGADEIRFDKKKSDEGQETETDATKPLSDSAMQALWLRRVQTKPADFLKSKFAYQLAFEDGKEGDE